MTHYFGSTGLQLVTLDSGASQNADFEKWASGPSERRDVTVATLDEPGHQSAVLRANACWPRDYQAAADLAGGAGAVSVRHMRLECGNPHRAGLPRP